MGSGVEKVAVCHPVADSPMNVALASLWPVELQTLPMWVPVFFVDL